MKRLTLVRPAKSDWSLPEQNYWDRTLSPRGQRDAPEMARRLRHRKRKTPCIDMGFIPFLGLDSAVTQLAPAVQKIAPYCQGLFELQPGQFHVPYFRRNKPKVVMQLIVFYILDQQFPKKSVGPYEIPVMEIKHPERFPVQLSPHTLRV